MGLVDGFASGYDLACLAVWRAASALRQGKEPIVPSCFPGMDPFLERNPLFHELHTQMLCRVQGLLQPRLRPRYIAKLERHLSEGDASLVVPTGGATEDLKPEERGFRKQRRIVIYVNATPRLAVTTVELLSPSNKETGSVGQTRYLEKRASALHGGLHWVEIDLLRGGQRPPLQVTLPQAFDYLAYIAQATPTGWAYRAYGWGLRDPMPPLPIPLLGNDHAILDLGACFRVAYDAIAADEEAGYTGDPPPPPLRSEDRAWVDTLLREKGLRV